MTLSVTNWLLAFSPILLVLILMMVFQWGGSKAGALAWFGGILLAVLRFGAGPLLIGYTQAKAVLLSLDVLYIIWMALLLFHIANESGAVRLIGSLLTAMTPDRTLQGLLIGWVFASFLQGMGGFGVPVAVTAPLLVGMGFSPIQSVVMACIGHGWGVSFGSMASGFQTLIAVTNLPGETLAPYNALFLALSCLPSGLIVALVAGGWRGMLRTLPAVLVLSVAMGGGLYLLCASGIWTLGTTGGAMLGLAAGYGLTRLPLYRAPAGSGNGSNGLNSRQILIALSAYLVLIVLAFAINLIPALKSFFGQVRLSLDFPALQTSTGWTTPAETGRVINVFGHPGAILFYASIIAYWIYRRAGLLPARTLGGVLIKVARGATNSSLGILSMVSLAVVMSHTGMSQILAEGMSAGFGKEFFPLVSPFIGALGAVITGSNNNSNVLFAILQMRTAELLGLSVPMILGAQSAGGALGSVIAPAKIIVGCSTVGLSGREGEVMKSVVWYELFIILLLALVVFGLA